MSQEGEHHNRHIGRRASCVECPNSNDDVGIWHCSDHVWITTFGKWWIGITGSAVVLMVPLIVTFLVFISKLSSAVDVLKDRQIADMKALTQTVTDVSSRVNEIEDILDDHRIGHGSEFDGH